MPPLDHRSIHDLTENDMIPSCLEITRAEVESIVVRLNLQTPLLACLNFLLGRRRFEHELFSVFDSTSGLLCGSQLTLE
jgi:hypothetical protein